MNRSNNVLIVLTAIATLFGAASVQAHADELSLSWWTTDGGGQMWSTGADYKLGGTIGQPDANAAVMTGGEYKVTGGFWAVVTAAPCNPCDTNCDGSVNGFDIQPFVALLSGTGTACGPCAGDTNTDGSVNGFDIQGFIDCLKAP